MSYFILFVLSSVGKDWNDGSDTSGRGYLASVDHNEQFHDVVIDLTTATLNDKHIFATHRFANLHASFHLINY